jgi:hypothetical protein
MVWDMWYDGARRGKEEVDVVVEVRKRKDEEGGLSICWWW